MYDNLMVFGLTLLEGISAWLIFNTQTGERELKKISPVRTLLYLFCFIIFALWAPLTFSTPVVWLLHVVFQTTICLFYFRGNILHSLLLAVILQALKFTGAVLGFFLIERFIYTKPDVWSILEPGNTGILALFSRILLLGASYYLFRKPPQFLGVLGNQKASAFPYYSLIMTVLFGFFIAGVMERPAYLFQKENRFIDFILIVLTVKVLVVTWLDFRDRERMMREQRAMASMKEQMRHTEDVVRLIRQERHEYRNRLGTILAMTALDAEDVPQRIREYIRRQEQEMLPDAPGSLSGSVLMDCVLTFKTQQARHAGIHVDVECETDMEAVGVDMHDVCGILGNLMDNAVEALQRNPPDRRRVISVSVFSECDQVILEVANTGPVILERDREHLFDAGWTTKHSDQGDHGFGLAIVRQLARRNGGDISVVSDETETRFTLALPYAESVRDQVTHAAVS